MWEGGVGESELVHGDKGREGERIVSFLQFKKREKKDIAV